MSFTHLIPVELPEKTLAKGFVRVTKNGRYFEFEDGTPFIPIGHCHYNMHRITEEAMMAARLSGESVIRVWPDGNETGEFPHEGMERLLALAARYDLYVIASLIHTNRLTDLFHGPGHFDKGKTIWNRVCQQAEQVLTQPEALALAEARIREVVDRWGHHPHIFAWEIVNEIDTLYRANLSDVEAYIDHISTYTRHYELERWGKAHLRTLSTFELLPAYDFYFHSPHLDFLSFHPYQHSVLQPLNAIDAALNLNRAIRLILDRMPAPRPYLNTEYGPILNFFDQAYPLIPEDVHDEWVHNLAWAHTASGGAGSGITIPVDYGYGQRMSPTQNRSQQALHRFSQHVDWTTFASTSAGADVTADDADVVVMACRDGDRLVGWLLRDTRRPDMLACIDRLLCMPVATTAGVSDRERLNLARQRLFALDAWEWLLHREGIDPQSQYTRHAIGLLLNRGYRQKNSTCLAQAARRLEDALSKFAWLASHDPNARALWATSRTVSESRVQLQLRGFRGQALKITWFDDRTGQPLWSEPATGSVYELTTPRFQRHLAFIVEPARET